MARKASIERDKKRARMIEKYSDQWEANRAIALDNSLSWDESHFGLSRITFRELALRGELPGIRKASW